MLESHYWKKVLLIVAAVLIAGGGGVVANGAAPEISFVEPPTPPDLAEIQATSVEIEASITEVDYPLTDVTFNWNGTNYLLYEDSLVLMFNFDNVLALGEDYEVHPEWGVADLSGCGNHGILSDTPGIPAWIEGKYGYGGAFDFTGNGVDFGQSILVPHDDEYGSLDPCSANFAIAVWIRTRDDYDGDILRKGSTDTAPTWYKLEHAPGGDTDTISLNFKTSDTDVTVTSVAVYDDNQWHFVVAQRNGDQAELWIDGVLDGTATVTGSIYNTANLAIGSKDTQADDFLNSDLDEVRIYMKSFTSAEIEELYNSNLSKTGTYDWNFYSQKAGLTDATYTYSVSATDSTGTTIAERSFTVQTPVPPTVALQSPLDGAVVNTTTVTFEALATDPVGLATAELYIGDSPQTLTLSGPTNIEDAQISADNPTTNYAASTSINVDGLTPHAHAVMKFLSLIGSAEGQIPEGATILSATLEVNCTNLGNMMSVYRLIEDWTESEVTWNNATSTMPWTDAGADGPGSNAGVAYPADCSATGWRAIDLTEIVQEWSDGAPNYGIVLTDSGTDGVDFDTSESASSPVLTVEYMAQWQLKDSQALSGESANITFLDIPVVEGENLWNVLVTNSSGLDSWAPESFTLVVSGSAPDQPVLVSPLDGATDVSIPAVLTVNVSDPDSTSLDVTFYGRKKVSAGEDFTIVVLPDTQNYSQSHPEIFTAQTQWIVDNKDALNIAFVIHEGDIVNNWNSLTEWDNANASMSLLDGVVPYSVVPGDHDHSGEDPPGSTEYYEQHFPASRFSGYSWWGGSYAGNYGGDYNEDYPHTNNNNYQLLTIGGQDYIFLSLDFCPSQDEIDWANGVLTTYSDRKAILTTHGLLDTNADYKGSGDFWLYPDGTSNPTGDTSLIWYDLIRNHDNLQLVLCGHMHGEAQRTDDNLYGKPVHQLLANYQGRANGGDGWLRIMRFAPPENKIYVRTYSPTLEQYEDDADSQFELDMPLSGYAEIATDTGVPSGSNASVEWTDLSPGTAYEWFVEVSDGENVQSGPTWQFTTEGNQSPIAADDAYSVDEDNSLVVGAPGVLGNDSDPDSDPLTAVLVNDVSNGSLSLSSDGSFTYIPDPDFNGTDTFTYRASDSFSNSSIATVTITVNPVNDAPVATDDAYSMDQDDTLIVAAPGVLGNDSDVDGDILSAVLISDVSNGSLTLNSDGSFDYTLDPGYNGPDSFTYQASDGSLASNEATVTITVNPVNYDAYVSQDPTVTYGVVGGGIEGTTSAGDGLVQTITEVPNGKAGMASLQAEYVLSTTANPAAVSTLKLHLDATWTAQDADDLLIVRIWDGSGWQDITADIQDGSFVPVSPKSPQDYVDDGGNIYVLFTDTAAIKKEKKDTLTIDLLYAQILTGPVDNVPSVAIVNPPDGAVVSGSVIVSADATDDIGVTQVEFLVDGSSIGVDNDASGGWSMSWDSTSVDDGSHTVSAIATDTALQTSSDTVNVTVNNVDDPPSVTITNPSDGATVSGGVTLIADATDDAGVTQVEFLVDALSIGVDDDGTNGWSVSWDSATVDDGLHAVSAVATDTAAQTASNSISVTVNNAGPSVVHVQSIETSLVSAGKNWKAVATVFIDPPLSGATVIGDWYLNEEAIQTDATGVTDGSGYTVITSPPKKAKADDTFTFRVTDVVASGYVYDSGQGVTEGSTTVQ